MSAFTYPIQVAVWVLGRAILKHYVDVSKLHQSFWHEWVCFRFFERFCLCAQVLSVFHMYVLYMIIIFWDRIYAPRPNEATAFSGLSGIFSRMERPLLHHHHQNLRQWRRRRGLKWWVSSVEWEMWLKKGIYCMKILESIHKKPQTKDICVDFSITNSKALFLTKTKWDWHPTGFFPTSLESSFDGWSTTMLDRGWVDVILTWQHHCIWLTILLALRKLMCCLV